MSPEFLHNVLQALPARIAVLDDQGQIVMVNQAWIDYCKANGLLTENFGVGDNYLQLCRAGGLCGEKGPDAVEQLESVLGGRRDSFYLECPCSGADQQCWCQMQVSRFSSDGKCWVLISHADITESKQTGLMLQRLHDDLEESVEQRSAILKAANWELRQEIAQRAAAEQAVSEERNRFRTLVDTISHGIVEVDLNWTIIFANTAYHHILEYPEGTLMGKCIWDIIKPDPSDARQFFEKALHEQPVPASYYSRRLTLTGKYVDLKIDWNYRRDAKGNIMGFIVVITNVTQQRRAEEEAQQHLNQLAHVGRVFTMNQMVSGLAHELNQPLTAISNFAQACLHKIPKSYTKDRNTLLDAIEQISLQADRAGQIIHRLRDFVRRADSSRSPENINDLVINVLGMLEIEARAQSIRVETDLAVDLPRIAVDRIQIEQVITNLVKNAMEAVRDLSADLRRVILRTEINAEGLLEVAVIDTGKGIEAAELSHIFEPFYTTKQSGMGLGLAISLSIVEAHGGCLEAVKNAHRGLTFRFALPLPVKEERDEQSGTHDFSGR